MSEIAIYMHSALVQGKDVAISEHAQELALGVFLTYWKLSKNPFLAINFQ
jgi:hypothetical protein